jgi:hypothetical protein
MLKYSLIIFIIFIFSFYADYNFSQQKASSAKRDFILYSDSTMKIFPASEDDFKVNVRIFSDDAISKYKNDPAFSYDEEIKDVEDWITKIKNWINNQLVSLRSSEAYYTILDFIYYGLMIIAVLLIIRGLLKADRRGLIFGKLSRDEIKFTENEEEISKLNFDDLISAAIENKNYKLAVRYLFLKSLQLLSEKDLIKINDNKTNNQYLAEIKNDKISRVFSKTTSVFEWIWYGNFPVDEKLMKSSQNEFNELFGLIGSG